MLVGISNDAAMQQCRSRCAELCLASHSSPPPSCMNSETGAVCRSRQSAKAWVQSGDLVPEGDRDFLGVAPAMADTSLAYPATVRRVARKRRSGHQQTTLAGSWAGRLHANCSGWSGECRRLQQSLVQGSPCFDGGCCAMLHDLKV